MAMKYYKKHIPEKWEVYAFEDDGSQDSYIHQDMIFISEGEAEEIADQPPRDAVALDILRSGSTERNWSWPPRAYQEAIGQVVVNSSMVEVLIRTVIWHVAGLDSDTGRAFTGKVRINELIDILKALIECKAPHLKDDATQIGADIKDAFGRRAVYVHQVWTVQNGLPAVGKLFIERYQRREEITTVTLSDMYRLADDMTKIQGRLTMNILNPLLPDNPMASNGK